MVLHATVRGSKRIPVSGLGKEDFKVYEDGVLQQIDSFSHEDIPVTVGLVIDSSGSMRSRRTEVIAAALAFARSSNTKDQLFVVNFNENVSILDSNDGGDGHWEQGKESYLLLSALVETSNLTIS